MRNPPRLQPFGRAALRTLTALDNAPTLTGAGSTHALVTLRKVLPLWAVRLLVASLLLAPVLVAVDGFARVRRRHEPVGPWVWWILAAAAPIAVALAFAWFLGVTGLLPATPPEPVAAGAIPVGTSGTVALVAIGLVALLGWIALRPALMRRAGARSGPFRGEGAGAALLVTWCAVAGVLWLRNPYAAALLVPGAHALLAVVAPEVRLRRALAVGPRRGRRRALPARRRVDRRPARALAAALRLVLRAARRRRRRRAAGLGHLEPRAHLPGRRAARGAAQPLERDAARHAADHRPRARQLRGPGLAGRHRVRSAAMRRALGTALVVAGLLVLADAAATLAWQEPLSALRAARTQHHLAAQLHALELAAPRHAADGARLAIDARALARSRRDGQALAELRIARIGLRTVVVRGTTPADLREGPGLIAGTVLPGQHGTTAIAGHRTTYGAPFRHLDALRRGDAITLRLPYGTFRYAVEDQRIVQPRDLSVLRRVGHDRLVLSACHPLFSAARRIVVFARLTGVGQSASRGGPHV